MMVALFGMVVVIMVQVDFGETDRMGRLIEGPDKNPTAMETCMPGIAVVLVGIFLYTMRTMTLRWRDLASELVVYED